MPTRRLPRRIIALQLLLVLPGVLGGRLCLDARWTVDRIGHIEVEHHDSCARAHDHRLCVLVFYTPWSPAPSLPGVAPLARIAEAPLSAPEDAHHPSQVQLKVARSPPFST